MRSLRIAAALLGLTLAAPAAAQGYDACIARVDRDPHGALAMAERWLQTGGGAAADHCAAAALEALGATRSAAERLTALAAAPDAGPAAARAAVLTQAGALWLALDDVGAAQATLTRALTLDPGHGPALRARAQAAMADARPDAAVRDLTALLALAPADAAALTLRAQAWRAAGNPTAALTDATTALSIAPGDAAALLAQGQALAALGRRDAARKTLLDAIAAGRGGSVPSRAQDALEAMESG